MKQRFSWNGLIVALTISLVLIPVIFGQLDRSIANWHLASAANALQFGEDGADEQLRRAEQAFPELEKLHDYWLVRIMQALLESPSQVPEIVSRAKQSQMDYLSLGQYALQRLESIRQYAEAVEVLELMLNEVQRSDPTMLNQLAYFRSLAAVDLDRALADINQALEHYPENEAFRDTRAWVLFQMGKPVEALEDAEFAVSKLEELKTRLEEDPLTRWSMWLQDSSAQRQPTDPTEALTREEANPILWNEGVLRFHRAKILESLGRDEQAQQDWAWLKENRLPLDGELQ